MPQFPINVKYIFELVINYIDIKSTQARAKRGYSGYTAPSVLKGLEIARLKIYIYIYFCL